MQSSKLAPGDTIGVFSPASPLRDKKKPAYLNGISYLQEKGYKIVEGKHVLDDHGYLAGTDDSRLGDLNEMINNPAVKAIICSRGGYGSLRLLGEIDYEALKNQSKIFVGYSDVTSLQLAMLTKTGLITFSGPMVAVEFGNGIDALTEQSFWDMITKPSPHTLPANWGPFRPQILNPGIASGKLIGGCFSLVTASIGTPYFPDISGAILILEDIDEETYCLDRHFGQLKNAGILDEINGLVLGEFINADQTAGDQNLYEVIRDYTARLDIPILSGFPYGHGAIKHTLPVGCPVELNTEHGYLKMLQAGVRDD
ncbi:LD-carboxypeptidase [candidate division KSB1 bacterium]|nr:LD-carboxypeptidase [candidate division KSB1 bacterium]